MICRIQKIIQNRSAHCCSLFIPKKWQRFDQNTKNTALHKPCIKQKSFIIHIRVKQNTYELSSCCPLSHLKHVSILYSVLRSRFLSAYMDLLNTQPSLRRGIAEMSHHVLFAICYPSHHPYTFLNDFY